LLETLINELGGIKILRLQYESGCKGSVNIDVLLLDGKVFSYQYSYGYNSSCDNWELRNLSDKQIISEMKENAHYYASISACEEWRNLIT
jgi:hypothetical protein